MPICSSATPQPNSMNPGKSKLTDASPGVFSTKRSASSMPTSPNGRFT